MAITLTGVDFRVFQGGPLGVLVGSDDQIEEWYRGQEQEVQERFDELRKVLALTWVGSKAVAFGINRAPFQLPAKLQGLWGWFAREQARTYNRFCFCTSLPENFYWKDAYSMEQKMTGEKHLVLMDLTRTANLQVSPSLW